MARCVYCLIETDTITMDHVFPSSWYTDNTPNSVQRWKVPSCSNCNHTLGKKENDLFIRMVPCIDPKKQEVAGLHKKVFETFGIGLEGYKNEKEIAKRKGLAIKIFRELKPYSPDMGYLPNFGPHAGFPIESQYAINIPADLIESVLKKVFRGSEYILANGRLIEPPLELEIYHLNKEIPYLENLMSKFSRSQHLGPGFKLERVASPEGSVLYKAIIWGTWIAYGSIIKVNSLND